MSFSRRQLLRLGQVSIACAAMPKWALAADVVTDPLLTMSHKSFEPLLGSTFTANGDSLSPTWLTLGLIEPLGGATRVGRVDTAPANAGDQIATDAFALHFTAVGADLSGGAHTFRHSTIGPITLFVTHGRGEYIAVVNHLLAPLPPSYQIPTAAAAKKA